MSQFTEYGRVTFRGKLVALGEEDIKGEKGTRVIRISDFNENGWVNNKIARYNDKEQLNQFEIKINDILLAMTGGTVGKNFFRAAICHNLSVFKRNHPVGQSGDIIHIM